MEELKFTTFLGRVWFNLTEKIDQKVLSKIRNKKLKNKNFTVISNNCFAGWVYRIYNLPYETPTAGLFIMPKCFLKMINNLNYYMEREVEFIDKEESMYKDYLSEKLDNFGQYPIGKIDDIEIHFLHYKTKEEAKEKWDRRKKRINYDRIIYKFNDQNGCTLEDIKSFVQNPKLKNKICFVSNKEFNIEGTYFIKEFDKNKYVINDTWFCRKYINLTQLINDI